MTRTLGAACILKIASADPAVIRKLFNSVCFIEGKHRRKRPVLHGNNGAARVVQDAPEDAAELLQHSPGFLCRLQDQVASKARLTATTRGIN